jgi:hypothetical protein
MKVRNYCITGAIVGAMGMASGVLAAEELPSCETSGVAFSSLEKAADLLTGIQRDNWKVQAQLQNGRAGRVPSRVADMSRQVGELQSIESALPKCEQPTVEQAAALVKQMQASVSGPGAPDDLKVQADALDRLMRPGAHLARTLHRAAYLAPNVGMTELFR